MRAPGRDAMRPPGGRRSMALVETVDIFPTLAELADVPLTKGMSDGRSFAVLLDDANATVPLAAQGITPREWMALGTTTGFNASFSQYARCPQNPEMLDNDHSCDGINRRDIQVMGYTLRTAEWRYTKWLSWNGTAMAAEWDDPGAKVWGEELYDHRNDTGLDLDMPAESVNLAGKAEYAPLIRQLYAILRAKNWMSPEDIAKRNAAIPKW